jgi:hypothetical protein
MRSAKTTAVAALLVLCAACGAKAQVRARADIRCEPTNQVLAYDCTIRFVDSRTNQPLSGLTVTVGADMPSMAGAHNVRPATAMEGPEKGTYRVHLELEMHGDWALQLNLSGAIRDRVVRSCVSRTAASTNQRRRAVDDGGDGRLDHLHGLLYCVNVKNITVTLDDETYRRARMKAAELDTSVSALVRRYLVELAAGESEFERLAKLERAMRDRITSFRASDRLPRDAVHGRRR